MKYISTLSALVIFVFHRVSAPSFRFIPLQTDVSMFVGLSLVDLGLLRLLRLILKQAKRSIGNRRLSPFVVVLDCTSEQV